MGCFSERFQNVHTCDSTRLGGARGGGGVAVVLELRPHELRQGGGCLHVRCGRHSPGGSRLHVRGGRNRRGTVYRVYYMWITTLAEISRISVF